MFEGAASSAKEGAAASMAAADVGDMGDEGGWGDSDLVIDEGKTKFFFWMKLHGNDKLTMKIISSIYHILQKISSFNIWNCHDINSWFTIRCLDDFIIVSRIFQIIIFAIIGNNYLKTFFNFLLFTIN